MASILVTQTDTKTLPVILHLSASPHIRSAHTVPLIMRSILIALTPALLAAVIFFGFKALLLVAVCMGASISTEWVIVKYLFKKTTTTINDYSAAVTGLLLALCLPPQLPLWMAILGSIFSIGAVKMAFGGLGNTIVNPALAGRAFLLASYPIAMTSWSATRFHSMSGLGHYSDALSSATPLASLKISLACHMYQSLDFQKSLWNLSIGNVGGCIGETSVVALLVGAGYLLYKRIITPAIPLSCFTTVFILFWIFNGASHNLLSGDAITVPVFQMFGGGLMLAAFFMATDPVTSPISFRGHIIFGCGCGIVTFLIRKYGGYPEGICYAILIMNLVVPLINRYAQPRIFGKVEHRD